MTTRRNSSKVGSYDNVDNDRRTKNDEKKKQEWKIRAYSSKGSREKWWWGKAVFVVLVVVLVKRWIHKSCIILWNFLRGKLPLLHFFFKLLEPPLFSIEKRSCDTRFSFAISVCLQLFFSKKKEKEKESIHEFCSKMLNSVTLHLIYISIYIT